MIELGSIRVSDIQKNKNGSFPVCLGKIHPWCHPISSDLLADLYRRVKDGSVLGERGHPQFPSSLRPRHVGKVATWSYINPERAAFYIDHVEVKTEGSLQVFHGLIRSTNHRFEHNLDAFIKEHQPSVLRFGMRALSRQIKTGEPLEITHVITWDLITSIHRSGARRV